MHTTCLDPKHPCKHTWYQRKTSSCTRQHEQETARDRVLLLDNAEWRNETAFKTRARDVKQESIIVSPEFGIGPEEVGITTYSSLPLLEAINLWMLLSKYWHKPHTRSGGLHWNIIVLKSSFPRLNIYISVAISCKTKQKYRSRTFYILACHCAVSNSPSTCSFCSIIC